MSHAKENKAFHAASGLASSAVSDLPAKASPIAKKAILKPRRRKTELKTFIK